MTLAKLRDGARQIAPFTKFDKKKKKKISKNLTKKNVLKEMKKYHQQTRGNIQKAAKDRSIGLRQACVQARGAFFTRMY